MSDKLIAYYKVPTASIRDHGNIFSSLDAFGVCIQRNELEGIQIELSQSIKLCKLAERNTIELVQMSLSGITVSWSAPKSPAKQLIFIPMTNVIAITPLIRSVGKQSAW